MESEKMSIVIACYNDAKFIEQSVQSALDQTYENKEIIVIDDGSNQETKAVLNNLQPKINLLITQENKGTSAARNAGIAAATGEYILILDSDDYFEPEFSFKAISLFQNDPSTSIVTCFSRWFSSEKESKVFKPTGGTIKEALINNVAMGSSMFKKDAWEAVYGYDVNMHKGYEDWEFYIRVLQNGGEAKVIPVVLFNYRNKLLSRNKKANLQKYELLEYIYLKHDNLYIEYFPFFIREWLESVKKSEAFKQQVMDSIDYKIGYQLLRTLRYLGFFKKNV